MLVQYRMLALLLGISVSAIVNLSVSYAENPQIAMGEPFLLRGSAKVLMDQPGAQIAPLSAERSLSIDTEMRTLGGAIDRSNTENKQLPAQKFPFFLNPDDTKDNLQLTIGYVRGINTPEAHQAGQSNASFVSSPAVIKVNGVRIHYIYTDGDMIQVTIPKALLQPQGFNVVQVEAGFYFLPGNRIAYDELQLQHLALSY
jgi:hypothetical protein